MNTNPDEAKLALWLDDELTGAELAAVEAWAAGQPEQLAARDEIRRWRGVISEAMPASVEPPYPDFFNNRVLQAIREQAPAVEPLRVKRASWTAWFLPVAACAGMLLAFWAGTKTRSTPEYNVAGAPKAIIVEPAVYTPERGVKAEWFASQDASATVIVLNGVAAIPDTMDFSATAALPLPRESDSTAGFDFEPEPRSGS